MVFRQFFLFTHIVVPKAYWSCQQTFGHSHEVFTVAKYNQICKIYAFFSVKEGQSNALTFWKISELIIPK